MRYPTLLLLAIAPLAQIVIGFQFLETITPVYSGPDNYDQDPAYSYLLNGLGMLAGNAPAFIDHPGTPLQLFIAAFIPLWALLTEPQVFSSGLIHAVLQDPEHYIHGITLALLVTYAVCFLFASARVFLVTRNPALAVLIQLTPLAFTPVAPRLAYLSAEPVLLAASALLVGILAPLIFASESGEAPSAPLSRTAGMALGFGIATKMTFLPLVGLLMLFRDRRHVSRALRFAVGTFFILIMPIWPQLPRFARWILDIVMHTGYYGTGSLGFIDLSIAAGRLFELARVFPLYFAVLLVLAVLLALWSVFRLTRYFVVRTVSAGASTDARLDRLSRAASHIPAMVAGTLASVLALQTLITIKHFGWHYMIPALPVAMIGLAWVVRLCGTWLTQWAERSVGVIVVTLVVATTAPAVMELRASLQTARLHRDAEVAAITAEIGKHENPVIVGAYGCTLPQCALDFGFRYTQNFIPKYAPPYLHNYYAFNIFGGPQLYSYVESDTGWKELDLVNQWLNDGRTVLLVSPEYAQLDVFEKELLLEGGKGYWSPVNVYRIRGLRSPL